MPIDPSQVKWDDAPAIDPSMVQWDDAPKAAPAKAAAPKMAPVSRMEKVGMGIADPIHGGAQLLTKILPKGVVDAGNLFNNWIADNTGLVARLPEGGVDQQVRERETDYQSKRTAAGETGFDGWRTVGNIISPVNRALPFSSSGPLTTRIAVGAASGAGSAALAPVGADDFWGTKQDQVLTGAAFGGATPVATAGVSRVISPRASVNPELQQLRSAGVRPTIGQTLGGTWNAVEEKLQSVPVLGDAIASQRARSLREFNQAAINRTTAPIGQTVDGVGQGAVQQAGDAISAVYDDALTRVGSVVQDRQFAQEVGGLRRMAVGMTLPMRQQFNTIYQNLLGNRTSPAGGMTARTFKDVDSELGQLSSRYRASALASEQDLGDALAELQAIVRRQAARSNPRAAADLARADEGWANLVRVEGAAKAAKNNQGVFTPAQLNQAVQTADRSTRKRSVARGTALMQDLSNAGQTVLGNKVPNSGTADRLWLGLGALGGGVAVHPAVPAAMLGGAALYNQPTQNALTYLFASRPQGTQTVADALREASPGLSLLSSQVGLNLLR